MQLTPPVLQARRVPALSSIAVLLALAAPAVCPQTAPPQQTQYNLQVQVPLVVEDVVVLDDHNQPVHNLTAANFTVTDDGKPVTPRYFDEHASADLTSSAPAAAAASEPNLAPNTFTNRNAVPAGGPLNILLFDTLNTPLVAQVNVRQQMIKFLSNMPAGAPIAIYGMGSRIYLLQGFTSNPALLKAALTSKKFPMQPSALDGGTQDSALNSFGDITAGNADTVGALFTMQTFIQDNVSGYQNQQRVQLTLASLGQLARFLSVLPGRKNLIWFSASFPLDVTPSVAQIAAASNSNSGSGDTQIAEGMFNNTEHNDPAVRAADDQLRRSQIAIYPVDARGVTLDSSMSAESSATPGSTITNQQMLAVSGSAGNPTGTSAGFPGGGPGTGSITMAADAVQNFAQQTAEEHATMNRMAEETGGKAFYNSGDLRASVMSAISLGSNYYTVTYTPPGGKWDGKQHRVEIKVNQPGLHLTYRRSYFADETNPSPTPGQNQPPSATMAAAMFHGAPSSNGVVFDANFSAADDAGGQISPGGRPNLKLMQPPYRTCTVAAHIDLHTLQMTQNAAGAYEGSLEFVVLVYDADGNVVNQSARGGHIVLPAAQYAQVLQQGLNIKLPIEVPARGMYFLRVGLHDPGSDRVGAIEIPVTAIAPTQAVAQSSSPAQP